MASGKAWAVTAASVAVAAALGVFVYHRIRHHGEIHSLTGVVLVDAPDPGKQFPVENASITVPAPEGSQIPAASASSNSSGLFHVTLRGVRVGETITFEVRCPGYRPLTLVEPAANKLFVIRMMSVTSASTHPSPTVATLTNLRVRYAMKSQTTVNVGSAAKVFHVVNTGDVPCSDKGPCSPDGKWKAAVGGASLEAGEGNEFRDARVSCIAGPCPFAEILTDGFSRGGQTISVSVETWSDTVTYLMEAEVVRNMVSDAIVQSFPAISDTSMDFTLPLTAEGPSIEAEVNGSDVVFPLGPNLDLPWATCRIKVTAGRNRLYHCDLKPGYQFKPAGTVESGS